MYLKQIEIRNIKCFSELKLSFTSRKEKSGIRHWTVLLGENGTGKSTLLRAIGTVLAGPDAMRQLLPFPETWVRAGGKCDGEIRADLLRSEEDYLMQDMAGSGSCFVRCTVSDPKTSPYPGIRFESHTGDGDISENMSGVSPYAEQGQGWLACGYGPFRRLSGGDEISKRILDSGRRSARFVTLFYESAALINVEEWLKELYNTAHDGDERNRQCLEFVKQAFQKKLLPLPSELLVDARQAKLKVEGQKPIRFDELSDGYRSMLALGVDLIRRLTAAFPDAANYTACPGIVLIDELDAHLHPKWQREIGFWLLEKFPGLQFIVATHSPFLAQVTSEQGGNILLRRMPDEISACSDMAAVETWWADQILRELFELESSRSPVVIKGIREFQNLNLRHWQGTLSEKEREKYQRLRRWVEELPAIQDSEERLLAENYHQAVVRHAAELKDLLQ